jgi:hypothetical protein
MSYMKGDYEEFRALRRRKNKANLKPNTANFKLPDRNWYLNSMENAYNANGSICKKLDI